MPRDSRAPLPGLLVAAASCAWMGTGCVGPQVSESALFLLDDEARAAGVSLEVAGEAQTTEGPIAVPTDSEVAVRRGDRRERIEADAGEVIAIEGADGRVRRGVDVERLVVDADREQALQFAELGDLRAIPLPDGRFLIDGENAMWTALLFPELAGRVSPWQPARGDDARAAAWLSPTDSVWATRTTVGMEETDVVRTDFVASGDLAAYVGAYAADDVVLVLDAQGGMHVTGRGVERHGTFGLDERAQLVFRFEDGAITSMRTTSDDELRDPSGLRFHTMPVTRPVTVSAPPSSHPLEGL